VDVENALKVLAPARLINLLLAFLGDGARLQDALDAAELLEDAVEVAEDALGILARNKGVGSGDGGD